MELSTSNIDYFTVEGRHSMTQMIIGMRSAAPYIRLFRGKTFVLKIGGEILQDAACLENLAEQVSLLNLLSIRVVLVHGGGTMATELSKRLGIPVETINGRRITNAETLEVVKMVFNGTLNTDLLAALRKAQVPGVGLSGVDGDLISAVRRPVTRMTDAASGETRDVDFGFVGDVVSVNTGVLEHLLKGDFVPVVSSLGAGGDGVVYNINADTVASQLAAALGAEKLILMTDRIGVLEDPDDPATLISHLDFAGLDEALEKHATGGMVAKLQACRAAVEGGVSRTHIISGLKPDSLLVEIFTNEGCGTLIERTTRHFGVSS